eukprot:4483746-Amphidinium_carterae.2
MNETDLSSAAGFTNIPCVLGDGSDVIPELNSCDFCACTSTSACAHVPLERQACGFEDGVFHVECKYTSNGPFLRGSFHWNMPSMPESTPRVYSYWHIHS